MTLSDTEWLFHASPSIFAVASCLASCTMCHIYCHCSKTRCGHIFRCSIFRGYRAESPYSPTTGRESSCTFEKPFCPSVEEINYYVDSIVLCVHVNVMMMTVTTDDDKILNVRPTVQLNTRPQFLNIQILNH